MKKREVNVKARTVWPFQKRLEWLERTAPHHLHSFKLIDNGCRGYKAICECGAFIAKPRNRSKRRG